MHKDHEKEKVNQGVKASEEQVRQVQKEQKENLVQGPKDYPVVEPVKPGEGVMIPGQTVVGSPVSEPVVVNEGQLEQTTLHAPVFPQPPVKGPGQTAIHENVPGPQRPAPVNPHEDPQNTNPENPQNQKTK